MDTFTPAQRSAVMKRVRSQDTKPEMAVRRLVHIHLHRICRCEHRHSE